MHVRIYDNENRFPQGMQAWDANFCLRIPESLQTITRGNYCNFILYEDDLPCYNDFGKKVCKPEK